MKEYITDLVENGYAYVPYNGGARVQVMLSAFDLILKGHDVSHLRALVYEREKRPDGEYEPDDGFIVTGGEIVGGRIKDVKCRLHYRIDTEARFLGMAQRVGGDCLYRDLNALYSICRDVFSMQRDLVISLMNELEVQYPALGPFIRDLIQTMFQPSLTSHPLLRLLNYHDLLTLSQASPHWDRSAVSVVSAEEGGCFYMQKSKDAPMQILSLIPGHVLVFFGEKAAIATRDCDVKLKPLLHGSLNELGEERKAVVSFWHTRHKLWDATRV